MPEGFQTVPDWFSFENQGAGVAVTDFGDGQQHLAVLMVDNPPQQNRGLYRIGHKLDGEGRITAYGSVIDMQTQDPTYVPAQ